MSSSSELLPAPARSLIFSWGQWSAKEQSNRVSPGSRPLTVRHCNNSTSGYARSIITKGHTSLQYSKDYGFEMCVREVNKDFLTPIAEIYCQMLQLQMKKKQINESISIDILHRLYFDG